MKAAIRYYTQTGNTKKLAQAIAGELGIPAEEISVPLEERVDVLFLCNSVYWAGADRRVKEFVKDNTASIGTVVNVSSAALIESTYAQMKKLCSEAGVQLSEQEFHCRGSFKGLHSGRPNEDDLNRLRQLVRTIIRQE